MTTTEQLKKLHRTGGTGGKIGIRQLAGRASRELAAYHALRDDLYALSYGAHRARMDADSICKTLRARLEKISGENSRESRKTPGF